MKKWILSGVAVLVVAVGAMSAMAYASVRDNDNTLAEIRGNESAVVLAVAGMT